MSTAVLPEESTIEVFELEEVFNEEQECSVIENGKDCPRPGIHKIRVTCENGHDKIMHVCGKHLFDVVARVWDCKYDGSPVTMTLID